MMIGAELLEGYVPEVDATVVERILDAGGEIAGKAVCEYYCVFGDRRRPGRLDPRARFVYGSIRYAFK